MKEVKKVNKKKTTANHDDDAPVVKKIVPKKVEDIVLDENFNEDNDDKAIVKHTQSAIIFFINFTLKF